ncbi:glycosyltransferase 87 family protein [Nakamurella leprariae]|uniref:DUF2029 domain-containing protein n=1 Tax=Nakamurella leprariae TaxID=2803911 RepID=A0A938YFH2_9ACTN|nr:glycosyltransferase 87 family protein [Nakamurella leprariae]MBM9468919.1 DUF2029 domain-containing protein [Nakamurella leprariae]
MTGPAPDHEPPTRRRDAPAGAPHRPDAASAPDGEPRAVFAHSGTGSSTTPVSTAPGDRADPDAAATDPSSVPPRLPDWASLSPARRVIPSWTDPTVRRASDAIGGPLGRHAVVGRNRFLTPLRVCLLLAVLALIAGWLAKSPCIQQGPDGAGGFVLDQGGQRPWITGCYNDVVPLFGSHQLDVGSLPYATSWIDNGQVRYMEYPVVTGYWMWLMAQLSHGYQAVVESSGFLPVPLDVAAYFTIGAVALGLLYLWAVASTARIARRRIWDTAIMCASPLLVVHAFTNWDLLAIALTAAAMLAWSRDRAVLAGVLIGLGTAAKLYPVLLLGPLLVLCLRSGHLPRWARAAGAAAVVWLAVNLPVMLLHPQGWYEFIRLNSQRPAEYDSWYFIFQSLSGSTVFNAAPGESSPGLLNALSLGLFLVACAAIGWLALSARRRPRFAQLAFLVVAAFLLTNKVWSPQYSLWLLPLVVLALPRWRPVLLWQLSEVVVWYLLMLSFAGVDEKGLPIHPFLAAAIVRDVLLVTLVVLVLRDILRPSGDLVRMAGDDDPSGGVLDGAADRVVLPSLPALWRRRRTGNLPGPGPTSEPAGPARPSRPHR